jgi:hypothetical protein
LFCDILPEVEYLKRCLLVYGRRMTACLVVCLFLAAVFLLLEGEGGYIGAVLIGCFVGALSFGISFLRVWQSSKLDVRRAKRQMAMGAIVRLLLILLVFGTAVQISTMVFFSVVGGFGLFYVLFIVHLILLARHVNEQ